MLREKSRLSKALTKEIRTKEMISKSMGYNKLGFFGHYVFNLSKYIDLLFFSTKNIKWQIN